MTRQRAVAAADPVDGPEGTPVLEAAGIVQRFGGVTAVDGVDLAVPPGRVTALIGPNGAGKTTLFGCLSGVYRPTAGRVRYGSRDLTRAPSHVRARLGIARTFQQVAVFSSLTVAENLMVGAEAIQRAHLLRGLLGVEEIGREEVRRRVSRAMDLVGLHGMADVRAGALPSGMLRLVELGRALAAQPRVLLLDEPASGLDDAETEALQRLLRSLAADGMAVLLVEHDMELVFAAADTVAVLAAGRIVVNGPPDEVRADPRVRQAYLDPEGAGSGAVGDDGGPQPPT